MITRKIIAWMIKMEKLDIYVPSIELCKKIPGFYFCNSMLMWVWSYVVEKPPCVIQRQNLSRHHYVNYCAAPMLTEILNELVFTPGGEPTLEWDGGWHINGEYHMTSAEDAAMKAWLKAIKEKIK